MDESGQVRFSISKYHQTLHSDVVGDGLTKG